MNTNGATYQNGRFVNVDEVHNNTKNMTLSGFNQEGGTVTGNIENLTIESKQNTSTTKGSRTGGSLSIAPNGMPSGSANYSKTNGKRKVVDNASTFIIGDGSNLKVGKVENTAGAIGATGSGKLSVDEYIGHNLENVDKLKTVGGSVGISTTGISSIGLNYSDRKQEGVTKNTVIGNVEIAKSSGDEINKDLGSMTEITKDRDFKTNINIESQTIKYALNPSQFKEDSQIAIIEGKTTGRTVVKTIDNILNGDKSQDIGDAERRSLIEIKEAIVRVQTAPAMDIIAKEDLADKNVQARLKVEIEKFDPNDPTLSEKVRERLNELKSEGKEIVAFYDKVTKKIFINQNAKDEEVRASIAREYKIKEDLELGRGKANDKGQLRSTVAGEIAYEEIKNRLKKGDKNPLKISNFIFATMNLDSEVTSDIITKEELKFRRDYQDTTREYHLPTGERFIVLKEGFMELGKGTATATIGTFISPYGGLGIPAIALGTSTGIEGLNKIGSSLFAPDQDLGIAVNPIRDSIFKGNQNVYEAVENVTIIGTTIIAQNIYNTSLSKTVESPRKQLENLGIKVEEKNIGLQVDGTTTRGLEIDKALGNNLGATFKTFDNFNNGVATSVKSVDLNAKSYQDGMKLFYKLNKDLRAINSFTQGALDGLRLKSSQINTRVLQIVINNQTLNNVQIENLRRISENANKMNIKVEVIILK